jgi:two-component system chemotaxis response regulator CheV
MVPLKSGGEMATKANTGILLESGTNELEIIELYIDEVGGYRGYFGINVAKVIELIGMPPVINKPPNTASFVRGVFNHRGKVITLIDLAVWLGRNSQDGERPIIIITEFNNITSAFLVSGVTRIHRCTWANINPIDPFIQNFCEAITGTIMLEKRMVLMIDLERVISELDPHLATPRRKEVMERGALSASGAAIIEHPLKVLHADDSGLIRKTTRQFLEEQNEFMVTSVTDGMAAWEYLEGMKKRANEQNASITDLLDIVLSDIEMPRMDGYHLCQKIKNDQILKALPVVLFSSLITDKLRHKGQSVGVDAQFSKPNLSELGKALKEIASIHRLKLQGA